MLTSFNSIVQIVLFSHKKGDSDTLSVRNSSDRL